MLKCWSSRRVAWRDYWARTLNDGIEASWYLNCFIHVGLQVDVLQCFGKTCRVLFYFIHSFAHAAIEPTFIALYSYFIVSALERLALASSL